MLVALKVESGLRLIKDAILKKKDDLNARRKFNSRQEKLKFRSFVMRSLARLEDLTTAFMQTSSCAILHHIDW